MKFIRAALIIPILYIFSSLNAIADVGSIRYGFPHVKVINHTGLDFMVSLDAANPGWIAGSYKAKHADTVEANSEITFTIKSNWTYADPVFGYEFGKVFFEILGEDENLEGQSVVEFEFPHKRDLGLYRKHHSIYNPNGPGANITVTAHPGRIKGGFGWVFEIRSQKVDAPSSDEEEQKNEFEDYEYYYTSPSN